MSWRYQPVVVTEGEETWITLAELYFDEADRLCAWQMKPINTPMGDTVEELTDDLVHMLCAARRWVPVPFEALAVGMVFERVKDDVDRALASVDEPVEAGTDGR